MGAQGEQNVMVLDEKKIDTVLAISLPVSNLDITAPSKTWYSSLSHFPVYVWPGVDALSNNDNEHDHFNIYVLCKQVKESVLRLSSNLHRAPGNLLCHPDWEKLVFTFNSYVNKHFLGKATDA